MDWNLAIKRNCEALQQIVAALFALAGMVEGAAATTMPRYVYQIILRVLRPAESALRRLIIIAARDLVLKPRAVQSAPIHFAFGPSKERTPAFQLLDPLKHFSPSFEYSKDPQFDGEDDDFELESGEFEYPEQIFLPRISVPNIFEPACVARFPTPSMFDEISATHVARRLAALNAALKNLPSQARRLARWQARRDLAFANKTKFHRMSPTRPGFPPGFRKKPFHEIDHILRECHGLVMDLRFASDTS